MHPSVEHVASVPRERRVEGGHPHTVFPTSYDESPKITGGAPAEVE